jgi:hypothetical protein
VRIAEVAAETQAQVVLLLAAGVSFEAWSHDRGMIASM